MLVCVRVSSQKTCASTNLSYHPTTQPYNDHLFLHLQNETLKQIALFRNSYVLSIVHLYSAQPLFIEVPQKWCLPILSGVRSPR